MRKIFLMRYNKYFLSNCTTVMVVMLALLLALSGCGGANVSEMELGKESYSPKYAVGFEIHSLGDSSSVITVKNPWQGASGVAHQLFLSRAGELPPEGFLGTVVESPLKRVVCLSSSHIAFIDELGEVDAVRGVSGGRYITNPTISERYESGEVRDVGYDATVNFELIASLSPDLVMIYGVAGENSTLTRKLDELSIPYLYIGDYLEQSPRGKAEWLVVFGEMFNKREVAEELFNGICERYDQVLSLLQCADSISQISAEIISKPVVMLNSPYRDTWFVPGDRNYMVQLIYDAGGDYACKGDDSDRSRPISGESAFVHASASDIWLNPGMVVTMEELKSQNPRFAEIPSVVNLRVFNCNLRRTNNGGSDFWESGAVRPDLVLLDMVAIIRPDVIPDHQLYYFRDLSKNYNE